MRIRSNHRIRQIVRGILADNGIGRPPIPVDRIAQSFGVRINRDKYEGDLSGIMYRDEHDAIIGVNTYHHPNRQRFTIAHELAHYLLHRGKAVYVDKNYPVMVNLRNEVSSKAEDIEEIEANRFAAELLMPYEFLYEDLERHKVDLENDSDEGVRALAQKYKVSEQAMRFRIMNLVAAP
jgi:Zn-dependent peptidase ImmA (M78 family)